MYQAVMGRAMQAAAAYSATPHVTPHVSNSPHAELSYDMQSHGSQRASARFRDTVSPHRVARSRAKRKVERRTQRTQRRKK